jgi:hypothetical protein
VNERIKAALIRGMWTFVLAFAAQPVIVSILNGELVWPGWPAVGAAALAAALYTAKKYLWPDTTF